MSAWLYRPVSMIPAVPGWVVLLESQQGEKATGRVIAWAIAEQEKLRYADDDEDGICFGEDVDEQHRFRYVVPVFVIADEIHVSHAPGWLHQLLVWDGDASAYGPAAAADDLADRLFCAIRDAGPDGLDRTAQSGLFSRHEPKERLDAARRYLEERQLIATRRVDTGGRPRQVSYIIADPGAG